MTASIIKAISLMVEAVSTFETSVSNCETTRRNIPEDCNFQLLFVAS
jgi:hypothetical protein